MEKTIMQDRPPKKGDKVICTADVKWPNATTGQHSFSFKKGEICEVYGINENFTPKKLMLTKEGEKGVHLTDKIGHFEKIQPH